MSYLSFCQTLQRLHDGLLGFGDLRLDWEKTNKKNVTNSQNLDKLGLNQ